MKSAARPRNDTTRLSALATGLRWIRTVAAEASIGTADGQNKSAGTIFRLLTHASYRTRCHPERSEGPHTSSLNTLLRLCFLSFVGEVPRSEPDWHCLRGSG